jgi:hypothetical protein
MLIASSLLNRLFHFFSVSICVYLLVTPNSGLAEDQSEDTPIISGVSLVFPPTTLQQKWHYCLLSLDQLKRDDISYAEAVVGEIYRANNFLFEDPWRKFFFS